MRDDESNKEGSHFFIFFYSFLYRIAGTEGFEPPNSGTKTRCLTAWPRPIYIFYSTLIKINIGIGSSSIPIKKFRKYISLLLRFLYM